MQDVFTHNTLKNKKKGREQTEKFKGSLYFNL